ncbi:MAG: hypothetical protein PV354_07385 [Bartonella sp.]|nr:hypothetical protein [Bartonella sp.]
MSKSFTFMKLYDYQTMTDEYKMVKLDQRFVVVIGGSKGILID